MLVEAISKAMAAVKSAPSGNGQSVPDRIHRPAPVRRR
jgi:hypothetical protein